MFAAAGPGRVATRAVTAGAPLAPADLAARAAPDGLRAMAVPVATAHAVGGRLGPGDRVDVVDTTATFVARGAEVLAVGPGSGGGFGDAGGERFVTVAVDAETALRLAHAAADGKVDVVRSTGAPPPGRDRYDAATEARTADAAGEG